MEVIAVGQISGAMGNFAHAPLELEEYAMAELGLKTRTMFKSSNSQR